MDMDTMPAILRVLILCIECLEVFNGTSIFSHPTSVMFEIVITYGALIFLEGLIAMILEQRNLAAAYIWNFIFT